MFIIMAINPIMENAVIQRTQDMSIMKHNVDHKGDVDQGHIQQGLQQTEEKKSTQVIKKDDAQMAENRFDSNGHHGSNYQGDGGKKRKDKEEQNETGRVIVKNSGGFDIKI